MWSSNAYLQSSRKLKCSTPIGMNHKKLQFPYKRTMWLIKKESMPSIVLVRVYVKVDPCASLPERLADDNYVDSLLEADV